MSDAVTAELIRKAANGDQQAAQTLLEHHRSRLRRLVSVRLDNRMQSRVDRSDVVQETIIEAARRLPEYLEREPIPFFAWLRQIATERLNKLHRRHVVAQKRSVTREVPNPAPGDRSSRLLARHLLASGTSPSGRVLEDERRKRLEAALDTLGDNDREVLILRHLEQLSVAEISAVLGISETAVKSRHFRAIHRLHELLGNEI